jgi:hypothetical protein
MAGLYVAAKITEHLDAQVFALGGVISGHTLKHVLAAAPSGACCPTSGGGTRVPLRAAGARPRDRSVARGATRKAKCPDAVA